MPAAIEAPSKNKRNTRSKFAEEDSINAKIKRLRSNKKLRLLDLFSGCGGLSLGFHKAEYEIIGAIEMDAKAISSHATNFHQKHDLYKEHSKKRDIRRTDPSKFFQKLGLEGRTADQVDIIVGGPPCQAFTRVGRAKLREIESDSNAFLNDSRSQLYKRYLEYVRQLRPLAILMENVPDVLNYGGVNIADLVCNDLVSQGYKCQYTLLNTVYYGVPQMRERMFLIAIHKKLGKDISFPEPTHYIDLPNGYHGSRNVALKHINQNSNPYFVPPPIINNTLLPAMTVEQALSDLPTITKHLDKKVKRGLQNLSEDIEYATQSAKNTFQHLMRTWLSSNLLTKVSANATRRLPRDYPIFKRMKAGDQYPEALKVAKKLFSNKLKKEEKVLVKPLSKRSNKYKTILKKTIPPYDEKKFPNKWRKMEPDMPARTLMAHLGKDSYSHIHYDSNQARTISVREAARLQTFPDAFSFSGSMNAAFRQIGNAVPPLMSYRIATTIKTILLGK